MPITAGYSADFYCDKCNNYGQFIGETWGDVVRQARYIGWRVNRRRQDAACPKCSGKPDRRVQVKIKVLRLNAGGTFELVTVESLEDGSRR